MNFSIPACPQRQTINVLSQHPQPSRNDRPYQTIPIFFRDLVLVSLLIIRRHHSCQFLHPIITALIVNVHSQPTSAQNLSSRSPVSFCFVSSADPEHLSFILSPPRTIAIAPMFNLTVPSVIQQQDTFQLWRNVKQILLLFKSFLTS